MFNFPNPEQQVLQVHAALIHQVVKACHNSEERRQLEPMLRYASSNGWNQLVEIIRKILSGSREETLVLGLDNEDSIIIHAILRGLQDPNTLPDLNQKADPNMAAPGLAHLIHSANRGDLRSYQALANMAEQMIQVPGDMRQLGGSLNRLLNGERDMDILCKGMSEKGEKLVQSILDELDRLTEH